MYLINKIEIYKWLNVFNLNLSSILIVNIIENGLLSIISMHAKISRMFFFI